MTKARGGRAEHRGSSAGTHDQKPTIFVDTSMVFVIRPVYVLHAGAIDAAALSSARGPPLQPRPRRLRRFAMTVTSTLREGPPPQTHKKGSHLLPML